MTPHILVLEDEENFSEVLRELLEDEGYRVTLAGNALEALELASGVHFDLLLFDIRMQGMDGLEALRRMRQRGLDFPCLAMTGFAGDEDPIRALRLGVGDYLRKPFQPEQLLDSIAEQLNQSEKRQQSEASLRKLRQLALWASESLSPSSALVERIDALSEAAELPPAQVAELVLTGLVWGQAPQALDRSPNEWSRELLLPLAERPAQSLETQVMGLAEVSLEFAAGAPLAQAVFESYPGRFDPLLVGALERLGVSQSRDARRWLGLAQGLLAQGQTESARSALERVIALASGPPAVEAALTLGELSLSTPAETGRWVRRAVELARQLGPLAAARASQVGALLLKKAGLPEADAALRQAEGGLQALGLEAEAAVVSLALGSTDPELVELLLRPENEPQLAAEVDFLFPQLCRFAPTRVLRRLLSRYPWLSRRHPQLVPAEVQAEGDSILRLLSFGPMRVFWGGTLVREDYWRGPLVKYLFAYLVAAQRPVHESQLVETFWPDGPERSKRRLSGALSSIRRALQLAGSPTDPIVRSRDFYSVNESLQIWSDLREFREARSQQDWSRMQLLYEGPYLEGCYLEWAVEERRVLEEQWLQATLQFAAGQLESHPERALEAASKVLAVDPLQASAQSFLLKAYLKMGQPERVLREFERLTRLVKRELNAEPGLELLETYHRARLALP